MKRITGLVLLLFIFVTGTAGAQGIDFEVTTAIFYSSQHTPDPFDWVTISSSHRGEVRSYGFQRSFLPWRLSGRLFHADEVAPNVFDRVLQTDSCSRWERTAHGSDGIEYCQTSSRNFCLGAIGEWTSRTQAIPLDPSLKSSIESSSSGPVRVRCSDNFPPPPPPDLPGCTQQFQPSFSVLRLAPGVISKRPEEAFGDLPAFTEDRDGAFIPTRWALIEADADTSPLRRRGASEGSRRSQPNALVVQHPVHVDNGRGVMPTLAPVRPWLPEALEGESVRVALRVSFDEDRERQVEVLWSSGKVSPRLEQILGDRVHVLDPPGAMQHRVDAYVVLETRRGKLHLVDHVLALPQCCCPPGRLICIG